MSRMLGRRRHGRSRQTGLLGRGNSIEECFEHTRVTETADIRYTPFLRRDHASKSLQQDTCPFRPEMARIRTVALALPGQGDPLALAAAELRRTAPLKLAELHEVEQGQHAAADLGTGGRRLRGRTWSP